MILGLKKIMCQNFQHFNTSDQHHHSKRGWVALLTSRSKFQFDVQGFLTVINCCSDGCDTWRFVTQDDNVTRGHESDNDIRL